MNNKYLLCLCSSCLQNFQEADGYQLRRARFHQKTKDICTYCNSRYGYDYCLEPLEPIDLAEMPDDEEDFYDDCI